MKSLFRYDFNRETGGQNEFFHQNMFFFPDCGFLAISYNPNIKWFFFATVREKTGLRRRQENRNFGQMR
jgi:hypothetical protein